MKQTEQMSAGDKFPVSGTPIFGALDAESGSRTAAKMNGKNDTSMMRQTGRGQTEYLPEGLLSRSPENTLALSSMRGLESAMNQGRILESTAVMCDCQTMQLQVDLGEIRGIIDREDAAFSPDGSPVKDIAIITRVGKMVQFKIKGFSHNEKGEPVAILSRKEAQREGYHNFVSHLSAGDILPVRITHLEPFGAFCDIGCGIVALLTVDAISVSRISHPADRFETGEVIMALVRQYDRDTGRIYLTHRELLGTWEENAADFRAGQTVTGIVRSVEEYGIFVELTPNLAGLAEVSDGVQPGDACSVYIKSILPERMKIKLVLIDNCGKSVPQPCRYFIDTEKVHHMSRWVYSPRLSKKMIETVFDDIACQVQLP